MSCGLESRELMALCLSNVSGLKATKGSGLRTRLIDAAWIWTEPHSMRLKVRLTIQKEVQQGTILQQAFTVAFVVRNQQCLDCQAEYRQGSWKSLVQVRQRVSHKRTFLYLEQLILKHGGKNDHVILQLFAFILFVFCTLLDFHSHRYCIVFLSFFNFSSSWLSEY